SLRGYGLAKAMRWITKTGGGPALSGKDDLAHALLVKHDFPRVYEKTHVFLPSKDYLNARLTGNIAASYDSIHLFWVTDIRDTANIRYDADLVAATGIDRAKLPPLRASTDRLATLKAEVADEIGLARDTPVMMGSPDHQCACIGSGALGDFEGHLYIGTSSWIECLVPFKRTDLLHSIASFPSSIADRYQCVNEQDLAGGCLSFLSASLLSQDKRLDAAGSPSERYALLDSIAGGVEAGSAKVIFTPWLNGERTPVDDTSLRGGIHNISMTTNIDHIVRAVMEGVAFNTRWSLGYVERFLRRRLDSLRVVGGGARSALWCQIFADVLDREIQVVRDPLQTNARGAALIGAVGLGHASFDKIPLSLPVEQSHRPDPANRATYDQLYSAFLAIHRSNRSIYRRLNPSGLAR
ncbi:MAG: FGGY-family carbohydrate kinase, partial [Candidatus Binatia bacterium]